MTKTYPKMGGQPVTREEFEALLMNRRSAFRALEAASNEVRRARERGVERVTRDNLTTNMTMGLGLRLPRNHRLLTVLSNLHHRDDKSGLDLVIDYLNSEADR